jgi:hypothetical protein
MFIYITIRAYYSIIQNLLLNTIDKLIEDKKIDVESKVYTDTLILFKT